MSIRNRPALCSALVFVLAQSVPAGADQALEARLRDQLRQSVTQLRQLQAENARLKVELETAQQAAVAAAENAAAKQEIASLQDALAEQSARSAGLQSQLEQGERALAGWRKSYDEAVALARARDAEAKKFESLYREVSSHVEGCEKDNASLVEIGRELLDRYRSKGVLDAARAREPLLGLGRVEFERLAQEYHGRILDATVEPLAPASREAAP